MAEWTNGKQQLATKELVALKWGGRGFICAPCGAKLREGDLFRFVYANGTKGAQMGNFFVCGKCDGPDILDRAIEDFSAAQSTAKRWGYVLARED